MLNALLDAWARELAQALEMMTGQAYQVSADEPARPEPAGCLWYSQAFGGSVSGFAVGAEEHVWNELGTRALQGAGVELIEPAEARSTWFEMVQQAISGAFRTTTKGTAAESEPGRQIDAPPGDSERRHAKITTPDGLALDIYIAASKTLENRESVGPATVPPPAAEAAGAGAIDMLLDVQLPVSISFGYTQLRLKDVLKLAAGSVVELNRQPEEPVDVIVNDYVIARGEVVVLDGNYAVRIQEIVSRKQRMGLKDTGRRFT